MKFGLFSHIPWPEGTDQKQILEELTDEAQVGEALGFVGMWMAEHHFTRYGLGASSLLLASYIAARTTTIRLGTAVLVPPLHHPIRLAEDIATLDLISGGRLDLGFGRGSADSEYRGYGVDRDESQGRFQETINAIKGLWTTSNYSFNGEYVKIDKANLVPRPLQQPHPPIYIAATRTPTTLQFLASSGHPLIIGVVLDTVDALDLCRRFVDLSAKAGHNVPMSEIPFSRYVFVAETEEQAKSDTEAALNWTLDMIQWRRFFAEGSEVNEKLEDWRNTRSEKPPSFDYLYEKRGIMGTPEQCVAQIKELQQQGIEHLFCNFSFGGMDHGKVTRSMELFSNEVMPHFS